MCERKQKDKRLQDFESLAYPLLDRLYVTALRMRKNQLDAEDLVQDTFMKAWRCFHAFEPGTNFRAWIFRILTNNYINQYSKKKKQPFRADFEYTCLRHADVDAREMVLKNTSIRYEDYHELFDDCITAALDKLPEHYRSAVLLSDMRGLRYKEIAELLDCPIGTVMSRLSRGRQMLAKELKAYAEVSGYLSHSR